MMVMLMIEVMMMNDNQYFEDNIYYGDDNDTDLDYADDGDDPDLALQEVLVGRLQTGRNSQQLATSPFNSFCFTAVSVSCMK